ncbi:hypothetical protein ABIE44_003203 [Marmoricola sp. OAE513]|uniref:hypothetical protein n=1 Tax=Marmoricola sp. OAE513 TaxID=2817894 RepID=UPI001AE63EE4
MSPALVNPLTEPFLAAAEEAARVRPEVDLDLACELMEEAATVLYNGLALEGLDEHDTAVVAAHLATDLTAVDPAAAVLARSQEIDVSETVHDPEAVVASYLIAAAMLRL